VHLQIGTIACERGAATLRVVLAVEHCQVDCAADCCLQWRCRSTLFRRQSPALLTPQNHSSSWLRSFALPFVTLMFSCMAIQRDIVQLGMPEPCNAQRTIAYGSISQGLPTGGHLGSTVDNRLALHGRHVVCNLCCVAPGYPANTPNQLA
jgi:hypothetical protein